MVGVVLMVWGVGMPTLVVLVLAVLVAVRSRQRVEHAVQVERRRSATVAAYADAALAAQH